MRLIIDNNILFSIMNPLSVSAYLFSSIRAKFFAPEFLKIELDKYKSECLVKSKLSEQQFEIRRTEVESSITFFELDEYEAYLDKAIESLEDPKDSPYLALALELNISIWSNDPHLKQQSSVKVFTTQELIEKLLKDEI